MRLRRRSAPGRRVRSGQRAQALLTEIENFFEIYKTLEVDKPTTLRGWGPRKVALEIVRNAQEAFRTSS
ncbi:MAG TPA: inorganic diphosphatase [Chloroflexota bacterium]|nr:inorganic diphosphatase [Chloroflexota bacterium]